MEVPPSGYDLGRETAQETQWISLDEVSLILREHGLNPDSHFDAFMDGFKETVMEIHKNGVIIPPETDDPWPTV